MLALAGIYVAVPELLIAIFGAAPDVVEIATPIIVLYGVIQVVDGALVVMYGALTGAGDTRFTMGAGLFSAWAVKLPVALIAVLGFSLGAWGAWLGISAEILFGAGLGAWRVLGRRWLTALPASSATRPVQEEAERYAVNA
jgi:Na+-driven multidrug efflux pump